MGHCKGRRWGVMRGGGGYCEGRRSPGYCEGRKWGIMRGGGERSKEGMRVRGPEKV